MKLKFDPSLDYQNDAVKTVVDIFDGQPIAQSSFELSHTTGSLGLTQTELAVGNSITLDDDKLLECIGRINVLLAISKQTLILAFCLFLVF